METNLGHIIDAELRNLFSKFSYIQYNLRSTSSDSYDREWRHSGQFVD